MQIFFIMERINIFIRLIIKPQKLRAIILEILSYIALMKKLVDFLN